VWFFTVFPSTKISNTVIEPYNTVLVLDKLKDAESENVTVLDNEALYNICFNTLGLRSPTFQDINMLIANVMAGNTASFRFPGQINTDMNKLSYSLKTRKFLHYYVPSYAPLTSNKLQSFRKLSVASLVKQMVDESQFMCDISPEPAEVEKRRNDKAVQGDLVGKLFSYAALFRGPLTTKAVDEAMTYIQPKSELEDRLRKTLGYQPRFDIQLSPLVGKNQFFDNSPRQAFTTITNYSFDSPMSCTFLQNTSAIKFKFLKIVREAVRMYSSSAFTHWFAKESIEITGIDQTIRLLPNALKALASEWVGTFGNEDGTEYPEALDVDNIM